jgi:hypothetical protein
VSAQRCGEHIGAGFLHLLLHQGHPLVLDDGYDGRRTRRERRAQRLQPLIGEALVPQFGGQTTDEGTHRRRDDQGWPCQQTDGRAGDTAYA